MSRVAKVVFIVFSVDGLTDRFNCKYKAIDHSGDLDATTIPEAMIEISKSLDLDQKYIQILTHEEWSDYTNYDDVFQLEFEDHLMTMMVLA